MKQFMLFMLGSALLATAAIAQETPTKPAVKKIDAVVNNATIWGVNSINGDAYVQATNTASNQTYYMTIYKNNSTSITVPAGNYNIAISTGGLLSNMYVSGLTSYSAYNTYYWTFNNINITTSPSTVVSVTSN